ncbi:MAG: zinc-ribbon domain-containing protein [Christensenellales bacterium]
MFEDKVLQCRDCGVEFVFSVGEQEFYKEKGFDNQPTRCVECRRLKKQQRNQERYSSYDR